MSNVRPGFALLSIAANIDRHKLATGEAFLLLMDIAYPGDAPAAQQEHVRFVRNPDPVSYDANDGNGLQVYDPFNFGMGDLKIGIDGSIPETEVQASNVLRALQGAIDQYAGAVGADLNLYVVNTANPAGEPELELSFTIKETTSDQKLVHFKLGASSPLRRLFPVHVYRPNFCIWRYNSPFLQTLRATTIAAGESTAYIGGAQCGYVGSMTSCSKTIDGATGCQAHGNLVRIGTFPGIDTNGAAVASVA